MTVANGQVANQDTFNNAFPSKTSDDAIPSKWNLTNVDAASGDSITNLQKTVNEANSKNYAIESISAGNEITIDLVKGTQNRLIQSDSGVENLSITPFGNVGGWKDGTEVRLFGGSATNRPVLSHNDNSYGAILNGNMELGLYDGITLVWFESLLRWVEITRNN